MADTNEDDGVEIKSMLARRITLVKRYKRCGFLVWLCHHLWRNTDECRKCKMACLKNFKELKNSSTESKMKKSLEYFFHGATSESFCCKSQSLEVSHRPCIIKEELIKLYKKADAIYESFRRSVYSVRETMSHVFKAEVSVSHETHLNYFIFYV